MINQQQNQDSGTGPLNSQAGNYSSNTSGFAKISKKEISIAFHSYQSTWEALSASLTFDSLESKGERALSGKRRGTLGATPSTANTRSPPVQTVPTFCPPALLHPHTPLEHSKKERSP